MAKLLSSEFPYRLRKQPANVQIYIGNVACQFGYPLFQQA